MWDYEYAPTFPGADYDAWKTTEPDPGWDDREDRDRDDDDDEYARWVEEQREFRDEHDDDGPLEGEVDL